MKMKVLAVCGALCASFALCAAVDENLPWKWDESGRTPPPAPSLVGSGISVFAFNNWGIARVCAIINGPGLAILVR